MMLQIFIMIILACSAGAAPITTYSVLGERCSGTNFVRVLVDRNTSLKKRPWGHKHFQPWYDLPAGYWRGAPECYTFAGSDSNLFILVVRNPYDWARSFHLQPWHAHPSLNGLTLSEFIRSEWSYNPNDPQMQLQRSYNKLLDKDPKTGLNFKNIFRLRTAKIKNMLKILQFAENAVLVRYEDLRDNPQEFLAEIASRFNLELKPFEPVTTYKGNPDESEYKPKEYEKLSDADLHFISLQLDHALEEELGYR